MCPNHRASFDNHEYFIRYIPEVDKFVFVNFSGSGELVFYHGKAIALSMADNHAVYCASLLIHETRVRDYHPFKDTVVYIADDPPFQQWIFDSAFVSPNGALRHTGRAGAYSEYLRLMTFGHSDSHGQGEDVIAIGPNDPIAPILEAQHRSYSWKSAIVEDTTWTGTTQENIQKYREVLGNDLEDDPA